MAFAILSFLNQRTDKTCKIAVWIGGGGGRGPVSGPPGQSQVALGILRYTGTDPL